MERTKRDRKATSRYIVESEKQPKRQPKKQPEKQIKKIVIYLIFNLK